MISMKMYWYPGCSTCKKAAKHFRDQGVELELINLATDPPSADELRQLWKGSGLPLKKFFNTSGQSYRNGGLTQKLPEMSEVEQLSALAADGMLIKRPIALMPDGVRVGSDVMK
jgi:arsenate reductase